MDPETTMANQSKRVYRLIVVERGFDFTRRLNALMADSGYAITREPDLDRVLERFEETKYDVLLITGASFKSGRIEGIELLDVIAKKSPATRTLFIADGKELKLAMAALKAGTYQYAVEPVPDEELRLLIESAIQNRPAFAQDLLIREQSPQVTRLEELVGSSAPMQNLYQLIRQAASTDIPVLITGDTGTGKDLVAQAIHTQSGVADGPYVPVHLGSLPTEILASELFGHEKGAFTGAHASRMGHFELARDGSIFLDEIGTVDEQVQVSLLRIIEQKRFTRLGGKRNQSTNARIIVAANEDLKRRVAEGTFREDLLFRLDVFRIQVPPLRERHGDIPLLVDEFMLRYNREYRKEVQGLSPDCVRALESYSWPGNVRELKNVLQRGVVLCEGETLKLEHLPPHVFGAAKAEVSMIQIKPGTPLHEVEAVVIRKTLALQPNRAEAARMLGISRKSLYNKIKRYDLDV